MNRDELTELHFITPIGTIPSILKHGILSNKNAAKHPHESFAHVEVNAKRAQRCIPNDPKKRTVHQFANLYLNARNPTLFARRFWDICVLRVHHKALDLPGAIVVDQNAVSDYARFAPAPDGLENVSSEILWSDTWVFEDDKIKTWKWGPRKCAELLVPDCVPSTFIVGAHVKNAHDQQRVNGHGVKSQINEHMFFLP